jgi:hypothetical protein
MYYSYIIKNDEFWMVTTQQLCRHQENKERKDELKNENKEKSSALDGSTSSGDIAIYQCVYD